MGRIWRGLKSGMKSLLLHKLRSGLTVLGIVFGVAAVISMLAVGEGSSILPKDLPFEFMLNALRLNEGFAIHDYRRQTGLEMDSVEGKLTQGQERGLLTSRADAWRPTELGRRFLNDLQASFLA